MPLRNDTLLDSVAQPRRYQLSIRGMISITTLVAIVLGIVTKLPAAVVADIGNITLCIFFLCLPMAIAWMASAGCKLLQADSVSTRVSVMLFLVVIGLPSFGASIYCLGMVKSLRGMIPYGVDYVWRYR